MHIRLGTFGFFVPFIMAVAPAVAQQELKWDNYCTLGGGPLCSSIELDLTPNGAGTDFSIRLRNLEGTLGNTPWAMYNVFFDLATNVGGSGTPSFYATLSGSANYLVTADPTYCALLINTIGCPGPGWGQVEWDHLSEAPGRAVVESSGDWLPRPFGIVGCDVPSQPNGHYFAAGFFQTCGDGWVNFNFTINGAWMFDDASSVRIITYDGTAIDGCVFGQTCVQQQLTAAPEPATMGLMAMGLFGVVGVASLRKRRGRA